MRLLPRIASAVLIVLCAALGADAAAQARPTLGPADGHEMLPLDTGRVAVGTIAPDFTLESKDGGTTTLSQFRGKKIVLLVFYRGHW